METQNQHGSTALIPAAIKGNVDIARMLIDKGAKLDTQSQNGSTALIFVADKGHTDIARMLIDKGAKLDTQSQNGNTALILAADKGHADIVRMLIDKGAKTDIRNKNGNTPLEVAVGNNRSTIAEMIRAAIAGERSPEKITQPPSSAPSESFAIYSGTGWVGQGGYIVTNYHVIEGQVVTKVRFNSLGLDEYPAKVILSDQHNDLAILQIETGAIQNKPKALLVSPIPSKIGAEVFTVGYPKSDVMGVNPKVTNGIISSLSGIRDDPRIIQTTVAIQQGNSGGPLMTMNGEVVGVTTAMLRAKVNEQGVDVPQNVNYAVKSAYVAALLSSLPQDHSYPTIRMKSTKLEDMIPMIQGSIVQVIVVGRK